MEQKISRKMHLLIYYLNYLFIYFPLKVTKFLTLKDNIIFFVFLACINVSDTWIVQECFTNEQKINKHIKDKINK